MRAIEVVTMEDPPRVVLHEGQAVHDVLHAWGTNGIITKIWLALTPAVEWAQCRRGFRYVRGGVHVQRDSRGERCVDEAAGDGVRVADSFVLRAGQAAYTRKDKALVFFMIAASQLEALDGGSGGCWRRGYAWPRRIRG